jgi:hypothetical protein
MPSILIFILLSLTVFAQSPEQPAKENTLDLRNYLLIFRIEDVKSGKIYQLDRTSISEHYLRLINGKDEELRKVDSKEAKKLDQDFAAKFIRIQYEIASPEGKCDVTLRLHMKGEDQDICEKDEKKSQEVASFVSDLAKRF